MIFSEIARRTTLKKNRVLFLVHRREILDQTITTFKKQKVDLNLLARICKTIDCEIGDIIEYLPPNDKK